MPLLAALALLIAMAAQPAQAPEVRYVPAPMKCQATILVCTLSPIEA